MINMPTDPAWYAKMAELEGDASIGAGVRAIPGMLAGMWARRHEISDKEWREAGPVLLGMALSSLNEPTPDRAKVEAAQLDPGAVLWAAMVDEIKTWPRGYDEETDKRPADDDYSAYRGDWVANAALRAIRQLAASAEVEG